MPRIDLRPRKSPRQARSADTVETILAAATRVLERESLAGFNTNRVAEVAGVSVGSLYQYFPNKSALIAALIDRQQSALAQAIEDCVAAHEGRSLLDALYALADLGVEASEVGQGNAWTAVESYEPRPPRTAGEIVTDEGDGGSKLVEFLASKKFV